MDTGIIILACIYVLIHAFFVAIMAGKLNRPAYAWFFVSLLVSPPIALLGLIAVGEWKHNSKDNA